MASPPGNRRDKKDFFVRFIQTLPLAIRELEGTVAHLIDSSWDEMIRRRAHHMASALADASASSGLPDVASLTRAIASLLKLRLEDVLTIQDELRVKVCELLEQLKDLCQESGESAQA